MSQIVYVQLPLSVKLSDEQAELAEVAAEEERRVEGSMAETRPILIECLGALKVSGSNWLVVCHTDKSTRPGLPTEGLI